jgi:crotonobetainyl-CoA:carnitine CoA-transferase CaiB-like acyl-CoA transferase
MAPAAPISTGNGTICEAPQRRIVRSSTELNIKLSTARPIKITHSSPANTSAVSRLLRFSKRDDEYITIAALPHQWQQIVKVLGQPALMDDVRFKTARDRRANNLALKAIIEQWLQNFPSRDAALQALERERALCSSADAQ